MTWKEVKSLTNQKTLRDSLLNTKNPETPVMTSDLQSVANAFTNMLVLLGKMQGITGIPLADVICHILKGPNDADIDNMIKDPPLFGESWSPYFSINDGLIALAQILWHDLTHHQLSASLETIMSDRHFEPSFLANMVVVYNVLHASWSKSAWWSPVKKFSKTKNGCQVYRTLHIPLKTKKGASLPQDRGRVEPISIWSKPNSS